MDISPDHAAFRAMCKDFAEREIAPLVDEAEATGVYPKALRKKAADSGLIGLMVPERFGGSGAGATFQVIASEELARVCAGLATGITGGLGLGLLCDVGSPEQHERYLLPTIRGDISGAFAMTEPNAGSDVLGMNGTAVRTKRGWHIQASKMYITGAPFSDYMFVVVYTSPGKRAAGISVFLVESDSPGIEIRKLDKLGHRSMETGMVFLDCDVPADAMLGEEGAGMSYISTTLEVGRVTHAARSLGVARAAYEAAAEHARNRVAFGQAISSYQGIQFKLARMLVSIRSAELVVTNAAQRIEQHQPAMLEACMAKLQASETAVSVASDAMQVFGGLGYIMETPVQRFLRDAYLYPISEGTTEMQLRTISKLAGITGR